MKLLSDCYIFINKLRLTINVILCGAVICTIIGLISGNYRSVNKISNRRILVNGPQNYPSHVINAFFAGQRFRKDIILRPRYPA